MTTRPAKHQLFVIVLLSIGGMSGCVDIHTPGAGKLHYA